MQARRALLASLIFLAFLIRRVYGVTCPSDYYPNPLHDTCVTAFPASVTWQDARIKCGEVGGQLVRSDSFDMVTFLTDTINNNGISISRFWVDVNDLWENGDYRRLDGVNVTYFRWRDGQPNGGRRQGCMVQFVRDTGSEASPPNNWEDKHCIEFSASAVCEVWPEREEATIDTLIFEIIQAPPETNVHLQILDTRETSSAVECSEGCSVHNLCDAFAYRAAPPQEDNCILLTLQEIADEESQEIAARLVGYTLHRVAE